LWTQVSERSFQILCDFKARPQNGSLLLRGRGSEPLQETRSRLS